MAFDAAAWSLTLQWGRDRMAAERRRACPYSTKSSGFNGAATGWPRNDSGKRK